jgi:YD repeat-containing protein
LGLDARGWLGSVTDPGSLRHGFGYTDLGLLASYTDPNGNWCQFVVGELGRLVRDVDLVGGLHQPQQNREEGQAIGCRGYGRGLRHDLHGGNASHESGAAGERLS